MKFIPLSQGKVAIVDDEDYERVSAFQWYAAKMGKTFYAVRSVYVNGKNRTIYLHRVILDAPPEMEVDHRDRNGLRCTRDNLRLATKQQNLANRGIRSTAIHGKGVEQTPTQRYRARIKVSGQIIQLGTFATAKEARDAYNIKAVEVFGEFAVLN